MGNTVCTEVDTDYLHDLKRLKLPGPPHAPGASLNIGGCSHHGPKHAAGLSARGQHIHVHDFDAADHNVKAIAFERGPGGAVAGRTLPLAAPGDLHLDPAAAVVVLHITRHRHASCPPTTGRGNTAGADAALHWASQAMGLYTPRGLAEPNSVDLTGLRWRAEDEDETFDAQVFVLNGRSAPPLCTATATVKAYELERATVHGGAAARYLFYNGATSGRLAAVECRLGTAESAAGIDVDAALRSVRLLRSLGFAPRTAAERQAQSAALTQVVSSRLTDLRAVPDDVRRPSPPLPAATSDRAPRRVSLGWSEEPTPPDSTDVPRGPGPVPRLPLRVPRPPSVERSDRSDPSEDPSARSDAGVGSMSDASPLPTMSDRPLPPRGVPAIAGLGLGGGLGLPASLPAPEIPSHSESPATTTCRGSSTDPAATARSPDPSGGPRDPALVGLVGLGSGLRIPTLSSTEGREGRLEPGLGPDRDVMDDPDEDLPIDDRAARLRAAAPQVTEVLPYLFVGGELAAADKAQLLSKRITHIVNCAGIALDNPYPGLFDYTTLFLGDSPDEPIANLFAMVTDLIERAMRLGGRVFVHCHQGVSRSCSFVIAFMMWKHGLCFDAAYKAVRTHRTVCSPNTGFIVYLLWLQRRFEGPPARRLLFQYAPYRPEYPAPFVYREVEEADTVLDPRGAYAALHPHTVDGAVVRYDVTFLVGAECDDTLASAARAALPAMLACGFNTLKASHSNDSHARRIKFPAVATPDPAEIDTRVVEAGAPVEWGRSRSPAQAEGSAQPPELSVARTAAFDALFTPAAWAALRSPAGEDRDDAASAKKRRRLDRVFGGGDGAESDPCPSDGDAAVDGDAAGEGGPEDGGVPDAPVVFVVGPSFEEEASVFDYEDLDPACLYAVFVRRGPHVFLWVGDESGVDPDDAADLFEEACEERRECLGARLQNSTLFAPVPPEVVLDKEEPEEFDAAFM